VREPGSLPEAWVEAMRRDRVARPALADPLPERRLARLLGAFILSGLVFLVLPGTLLGVWNLLNISAGQRPGAASVIWIQSHGHAQLFGWIGTFIIGICLYTVPKFRGGAIRSLAVGWAMFGLWTAAVAARWGAALWNWHVAVVWPAAAAAELVVALMLFWQCTASGRNRLRTELWNVLVFAGLAGLLAALGLQLALVWPGPAVPLIPEHADAVLLWMALWIFCLPVAWGFSVRFLPTFLGLRPADPRSTYVGLACLVLSAVSPYFTVAAVLALCWSLRIFHPAPRPPKVAGVDPRFPLFVRAAYVWLIVSAALGAAGASRGLTGASRHAFTVGFLATLVFSIGPRILPAFLNSRELWSPRLMLAALALLTAGCTLRVASEPLAYAGLADWAWRVLPVSAFIELTAVLLFAWNIGRTLLSPMPAWIEAASIHENLPLYWYVTSYPGTRRLLAGAGLATLGRVREVPRSLTLREAAEADGIDWRPLVALLREYFDRRLARALRAKR
jgi:uncharacterized protein involved in response to NO